MELLELSINLGTAIFKNVGAWLQYCKSTLKWAIPQIFFLEYFEKSRTLWNLLSIRKLFNFLMRNKRCLLGSKSSHKICFKVNLLGVRAAVSLIREATVVVFEETGSWLRPKWKWLINKLIKMNLSQYPTPSTTFCDGLGFRRL